MTTPADTAIKRHQEREARIHAINDELAELRKRYEHLVDERSALHNQQNTERHA